MINSTDEGSKRGFANVFPIKFWNFQRWGKNSKLFTQINMGAEDFTRMQAKHFAMTNCVLESVITSFRDLEATKKIEFEENSREFSGMGEYDIDLKDDI